MMAGYDVFISFKDKTNGANIEPMRAIIDAVPTPTFRTTKRRRDNFIQNLAINLINTVQIYLLGIIHPHISMRLEMSYSYQLVRE